MFLKNILSLFVSALIAAALSWLLNSYTSLHSGHWLYSLLYFTGFCFIMNLAYTWQAPQKSFSQLLFAGIIIKLLLALIILLLYSVKAPAGFFNFSVHFMGHYILFTIFEIRYLLQLIKNNSTTPTHEN